MSSDLNRDIGALIDATGFKLATEHCCAKWSKKRLRPFLAAASQEWRTEGTPTTDEQLPLCLLLIDTLVKIGETVLLGILEMLRAMDYYSDY